MPDFNLPTAIAVENELLFAPLGGAGEIGMNLNLYGFAGKWVMVDCGVTFGEHDLPGVDVVMPDPAFIADRRQDLLGLIVTHAHEDHIGAIQYLWRRLRCPIYATPFTAAIVRRKLAEAGLEREVPLKIIPFGGRFTLGPFGFELIGMTHSIPEPSALAIRTPAGLVLHTGDWKFDPAPLVGAVADEPALERLGDEGVLALIGDSTNVFRAGDAGSEAAVRASLIDLVGRNTTGRVAIACFASNVARVESAYRAARANGRSLALVGRSLHRFDEAARETGYFDRLPPFLSDQEAADLPPNKVLLLCTGSQGEPRAALARIASNDHRHIALEQGDTVIFSSRIIPGNEIAIGQLQNRLTLLGVEVVTELDHFVHVSGHPARNELARMYAHTRPQIAIPVHGELRHLSEHAKLARECKVPQALVEQNGDIVRLAPGPARVIDHAPAGRLAVDGVRVVAVDSEPIKERRRMLNNGFVVATVALSRTGALVAAPLISLHGIGAAAADGKAGGDNSSALDLADLAAKIIAALPGAARRDDDAVSGALRIGLRRAILTEFGRKPVTEIHVVRVGDE